MRGIIILFLFLAAVSALPVEHGSSRIFGGTATTIDRYPYAVSMQLLLNNGLYMHQCGGTIINNRSVLSAAHCFVAASEASSWQGRVGSSYHEHGGTVHFISQIIRHPDFIAPIDNADIAILRIHGSFQWIPNAVQPGAIAGVNYNVPNDTPLWAIGWGLTEESFFLPEQLRHVELLKIREDICRQRWGSLFNDSMMCAGWLDVGNRSQCVADSGGPVLHRGVVVGVTSFTQRCGSPQFPTVNARVAYASEWIRLNA